MLSEKSIEKIRAIERKYPDRRSLVLAALRAVHHLNLAHGLGARVVREVLGDAGTLSLTLNIHVVRPDDPDSADDVEAVRRIDTLANRAFLEPVLNGRYPEGLFADTAPITDWSFVQDADLQTIHPGVDVLGVNYYSTHRVRRYVPDHERLMADGHAPSSHSAWTGADDVEFLPQPGPHTLMGWNVDPGGMTELLTRLHTDYPDVPLMVTENGAAFADSVSPDGLVHDAERIDYLYRHIDAVGQAMDAGADVRGYFVWTLMDNFEWSYGYHRPFGLLRVEPELDRVWKDSAHWYAELLRTNALPDPGVVRRLG